MNQPKYYKKRLNKSLNKYIRKNRDSGYSLKSIEKALVIHGYERSFARNLIRAYKLKSIMINSIPLLVVMIVLAGVLLLIKPATVGYNVAAKSFNFTDKIGLAVNESLDYTWNPGNKGQLKSIRLSGRIKNSGFVKIYLEHENSTYLIFDNKKLESEGLGKITALAVKEKENKKDNKTEEKNNTEENGKTEEDNNSKEKNKTEGKNNTGEGSINKTESINETETVNQTKINNTITNETLNLTQTINETETINKSVKISLRYNQGTPYDEDDNGIETLTNAIDFSVANTSFNWDYNYSNLCTRWNVFSVEDGKSTTLCYGNSKCCNFAGLSPIREKWNEPLYLSYGQYGATLKNIISAQVLYVSYNLSLDEPFSEIYYSGWENLTAVFYEEFASFEKICVETCILPNLNSASYNLKFEMSNASMIIDGISYEMLSNRTINHPPVLLKNISDISIFSYENYTLNLSGYFYDEENDDLTYNFYNTNGISVSIVNQTFALIAPGNHTGAEYMFVLANDSMAIAQSNIFRVEIREKKEEKKDNSLKSLRQIVKSIQN